MEKNAAKKAIWLSAREVRAEFGISRKVVTRGVCEGRVRVFRTQPKGGTVRFSRADIEKWMRGRASTGAEAIAPSMRTGAALRAAGACDGDD